MPEKIYDIIIIGAGTAGLTAAIYACRAKKSVLVLESTTYGGQIINTGRIENWPATPHISGTDFATTLYSQAESFGANFEFEKVQNIEDGTEYKVAITEDHAYKGKAIIIATGSAERRLGLPNEEALIGHGISYCATCDGNFFKGKNVAVNGGGNTAFWDALYLSDICKTVSIIHRRDTFRADAHLVAKAKAKPNINFIMNSTIQHLHATDGKLSSLTLNTNGKKSELQVDGLFIAIGRIPANDFVKDIIDLDDAGYIISDESCHTNIPGIFVAGDNRAKDVHQLVTAAADGAIAANAATSYLQDIKSPA